jgi:hypothetical protein
MRWSWVAVGVVIALLGAVLLFVPVVPQGSETATYASTSGGVQYSYYRANVSGYSLSGTIVVAVSWTSNTSTAVQVIAAACSASCGENYQQLSDVTNETGTKGTFVLDQPNGGSIVMGILSTESGKSASVTFKVTTALATVATALVVIGLVLVIAGAVLRRKPGPPAPATIPSAPRDDLEPGAVDPPS